MSNDSGTGGWIDCYSSARAMAAAVAGKEISARELMDLHLARIAEVNPAVNAVVSLDEERARAGAAEADERLARGEPVGPLHGLPHAFKDTHEVAGWRTTFGSPLRADYVPKRDDLVVERIRGRGRRTDRQDQRARVGGRVAHVQPDLRDHPQPLRPDPVRRRLERGRGGRPGQRHGAARRRQRHGRLAAQPRVVQQRRRACGPASGGSRAGRPPTAGSSTSVGGPMARSVEDLALLLSVIAGPSRRAPLSLESPGSTFAPPLRRRTWPAYASRSRPTSAARSPSTTPSPT